MQRSALIAGLALVLASGTVAVEAKPLRTGQECRPAVEQSQFYAGCRIAVVRGAEVCRCAALPSAISTPASSAMSPSAALSSPGPFGPASRGDRLGGASAADTVSDPGRASAVGASNDSPRHSDPMPSPAT